MAIIMGAERVVRERRPDGPRFGMHSPRTTSQGRGLVELARRRSSKSGPESWGRLKPILRNRRSMPVLSTTWDCAAGYGRPRCQRPLDNASDGWTLRRVAGDRYDPRLQVVPSRVAWGGGTRIAGAIRTDGGAARRASISAGG